MATTHPKLAGLDLIQTTYKKVNDHEIRTDILIPQKPHTGKRPVLIRFHGGGLVKKNTTPAINDPANNERSPATPS